MPANERDSSPLLLGLALFGVLLLLALIGTLLYKGLPAPATRERVDELERRVERLEAEILRERAGADEEG